ncbi:hypothetical protein CKO25_20290 [Thiocapsa imhoffii]|uniref:Uncharacterized protein n=1 Tax=Thiocapsa imhoffii TaxID=382777 RepID=A0A9X0WLY7_9GAMM|nr:hypothetical protein [Thiocapsa imhoffii]
MSDTFYTVSETWNRRELISASLGEIYLECRWENWDGYGARAVTPSAFEEALVLLSSLPENIPLPEFAGEPDGSIGMQWENGPNRIFALSVSGKGVIIYAGRLGKASKAHGTEVFSDSLPTSLMGYLHRLFS